MNGVCTPLTVCSASQFESTAPTATTDRVCSALTVCTTAQFQSTPPTATTDRVCSALTVCTASQFESAAPTATTDRVCSALTVCTGAQFQTTAPTATTDRVCTALTVCTSAQFQTTAPTATSDRICSALTVCTSAQFQSTPPTATTDRVCTALTVCTASQFESTPPTATTNRVCTPISTCTAAQYQSAPPTPTSDRVCVALTVCGSTRYETVAPTATSDRVCTLLTVCTPSEYESTPPTATSDRACTALTICTSAQCETTPPTTTSNRVCGPRVLVIEPATLQTLVVVQGQAPPTATFTASVCGYGVNAAWTLSVGSLGTVNAGPANQTTFTPSGAAGGLANVIGASQGLTAQVQVLVQLSGTQNGFDPTAPGETAQVPTTIGQLTQGGGVGGVGGEGLGPALPVGNIDLTALQGVPAGNGSAQGLKYLYPYDATVWPRGMLAPLLQWDWSIGDADAIRIDLSTTTGSFAWTGYFGRPAILASLPVGLRKFIRHPIPQDVWQRATDTAGGPTVSGQQDRLTVAVTVSRAGVAYGPITETWIIAPARLTGTIYYQSYGTNLASNYSGAMGSPTTFGAAVLSIRGGDPGPQLVSNATNCQVCHSVAARGARLIVQAETNGRNDSFDYELTPTGTTNSQLARGVTSPGYPALYADGSLMLTTAGRLQSLPNNAGADLPSSGLSAVTTNLGIPAFSPDGTRVVFNPQDTVTHPGRELMVMDFDKLTGAFTNPTVVIDDALITPASPNIRSVWPQFFPNSLSLIFQHQLVASADGNSADAHTRKFSQGQIYWASAVASGAVTPLNKLNGYNASGVSYLPTFPAAPALSCTADGLAVGSNAGANGDITHTQDPNYNYEPTVNPVSSGGYAWVVFTSRRMYGSVANIPPFCSDPRGVDLHANMTTNTNITPKKLWVAAIDLTTGSIDGSHPGFYLPAQELLAGNARGFWVLDPCRSDNASCLTGDQCCGGFCQPNGSGVLVCSDRPPTYVCSGPQEACNNPSECCLAGSLCFGGFCATP